MVDPSPAPAPVRVTCHCGASELSVVLADGLASAGRCDCSFCRRRGAMTVSAREEDVRVVRGDALRLYQFGTMTAEHWFCGICGIYTHHRRRADPAMFGVNAGGIEDVNPRDLEPVPWFDGVNHPADAEGRA